MLGTIISLFSAANTVYDLFKKVSTIIHGDKTEHYLQQISEQVDKSQFKVERLSDNILYLPDLQDIKDITQNKQRIIHDLRDVRESLESTQQVFGGEIVSSAMIWTPGRMQDAMTRNPWEVLLDIRPANLYSQPTHPDMVPILFQHNGIAYLGWQLRGTLPMLFDCEYSELWKPSVSTQEYTEKTSITDEKDMELANKTPEEYTKIRQEALAKLPEESLKRLVTEMSIPEFEINNRTKSEIEQLLDDSLLKRTSLTINMEGIDNLSFLIGLSKLQTLTITDSSYTNIYDLSSLSSLLQLKSLNIGIRFKEISPLKNLNQVQTLRLSSSKITDISPLSELEQLEVLSLDETFVTDLSPLRNLTRITRLNLSSTPIRDLSPLVELKNIKALEMENTQVKDISILSRFHALEELLLNGNQIVDFSPLMKLHKLRRLCLKRCQINDPSFLTSLTSLETLDLDYALLGDLTPLGKLKQLRTLYLAGVRINSAQKLMLKAKLLKCSIFYEYK